MIFKSFDRFITESNSARLVPINESATTNFKLTNNTPESDEMLNVSISAVYNMPDDTQSTEEQAINVIKLYTAKELASNAIFKAGAKDTVVFIKIKTLKQKKWLNNNAILDADLSFKYADLFKSPTEINSLGLTPFMIVKPTSLAADNINIWDLTKDTRALTKGSTSGTGAIATGGPGAAGTNAQIEADKLKAAAAEKERLAALATAGGVGGTGGTNGTGGVGGGNLNAGGGGVTGGFTQFAGLKQGQKSEVVRQLQKMIIAGASAYPNDQNHIKAAEAVKNSGGADANYGKKTALAIGLLTNAAGAPVTDIIPEVVTQLTTALDKVTADQLKAVDQTKTTNTNKTQRKKSLIKRRQSLIKPKKI